ncbi:hypothetical protein ACU686_27365 [Yinghuangia aomiensis]
MAATGAEPSWLLCADRDRESAIFHEALAELAEKYRGRLTVVRHLDTEPRLRRRGHRAGLRRQADTSADAYLCGPTPFMDLVESAWLRPRPGLHRTLRRHHLREPPRRSGRPAGPSPSSSAARRRPSPGRRTKPSWSALRRARLLPCSRARWRQLRHLHGTPAPTARRPCG